MLNYGFIVEDNESNEFPFTLELTSDKPHYSQKINLIQNNSNTKRTYRILPSFTNQTVIDFFSYLRFILHDEEMSLLLNVLKIKLGYFD